MSNLFGTDGPGQSGLGSGSGPLMDINPIEYPEVKCPECGKTIFVPGVIFRKIPGTLMGQAGEEIDFPIKIFYCVNCKALSPRDQEIIDELSNKTDLKKETKSSLII